MRLKSVLLTVIGLAVCAAGVQAAIPPAGYQIFSQSRADYILNSSQFLSYSNTVFTQVSPFYDIDLSPAGTAYSPAYVLQGQGGDTLYCNFILTNRGNVRDSLAIDYSIMRPAGFIPRDIIFFYDSNLNGLYDPGEEDPSYLALAMGDSVEVAMNIVLPDSSGARDCYEEITAVSTTAPAARDKSVVKTSYLGRVANMLFIGPENNPKALPGGEGSADDVTSIIPNIAQTSITFINEILNESTVPDMVEIGLAKGAYVSPGVTIFFQDTAGTPIPQSPLNSENFLLGVVDAGERKKIRVMVSSSGEPLRSLYSQPYSIPVVVQSLVDSLRANSTTDRIEVLSAAELEAVIALESAFKQQAASTGDVVTLVVTVKNLSDSIAVDSVVVSEAVQPALQFISSPEFTRQGNLLIWQPGRLGEGEEKTTFIKFMCNGRVSRGKVKAIAKAAGLSEFGDRVSAGPVVSVLAIENHLFAAEGVIFGDVFIDSDGNGVRGENESGVAGAAIYLDSGEYALTDVLGKFTLPRAFSGYRIVRLDESSLSPGLEYSGSGVSGNGHLDYTRMVHLLEGGNAVLSFPLRKEPEEKQDMPLVQRSIICQEKVSIQKKSRVLFQAISVPSSHFETGQAFLRNVPMDKLRECSALILSRPGWKIFLEGHTDSIPIHNDQFPSNFELSIARAEAVERFLVANGVPMGRILTRGYGESRPLATNATREGRSLNRRVEVSLVPPGVDLRNPDEILRVRAELSTLPSLSDTFRVKIMWQISTDTPDSLEAHLRISVPDRFTNQVITVNHEGKEVEMENLSYPIENFRRSSGINVDISFEAAGKDTAFISESSAVMTVRSKALASETQPGMSSGSNARRVNLKPFGGGSSRQKTVVFEILSWEERYEAPAALAVVASPGGSIAGGLPLLNDLVRRGPGAAGSTGKEAVISVSTGEIDPQRMPAIILPGEGAIFTRKDRITVSAVVPLGSKYSLSCNGSAVSSDQIGEKVIYLDKRSEKVTWYGVKIEKGWNRLVLETSGAGILTSAATLNVALAGRPEMLECKTGRIFIPADGRSEAVVRFAIMDHLGLPAVDGLVATVACGDSLIANSDARPHARGLQVTCKDGYFTLRVRSSNSTGRKKIELAYENLSSACSVSYIPPRRSLFMTGLLEARLGAFTSSGTGSPMGLEDYYNRVKLTGLSRVLVQGTTYGAMNLTLRLDSKKRYKDPLLKTINTERQYLFYGDASELHFAAPSRGGNYVALERGESFVRYGDFRTHLINGEFLSYKRAATGVNVALTSAGRAFNSFLTKTDFSTCKDEIPADGTSGYYYLDKAPVVDNSEKIILETRDRYRPEKILEVKPLVQNRDYTLNYLDGSLLFKEPVPATDNDFNPVYIVVIYEVSGRETGERSRYLYGVSGEVTVKANARMHLAAVAREGEGKGYTLYGMGGRTAAKNLTLAGEVARSEDEITGIGNAYKIEASFAKHRAKGSVYLRRVDGNFLNPSFSGSAHELSSLKSGYESSFTLSRSLTLNSSGYRHHLYKTGERRGNIDALVQFKDSWLGARVGIRAAEQKRGTGSKQSFLSIAGLGIERRGTALSTHWEKNLKHDSVDDYPDRLRTSFALRFLERHRFVLNHEYLTSASRGASHQARFGIESRISKTLSAYTRYSMNRTASDERLGAVTGLKHKVKITERLSASFDVENYHSLSRRKEEDYFSLKAGLNSVKKGSHLLQGQYEYRWQKRASRHLLRLNGLREFANGAAVLLKDVISYSAAEKAEDALSFDGRIAIAYRPNKSTVHGLFMLKNLYERFSPVNPDAITWKLVFSTDVNVRPRQAHEFRLKYAIKYVEDYSLGVSVQGRSQLALLQFIYRFGRAWDIDLWGRVLHQSLGETGFGSGFEVGRLFGECIRMSAGYSINGFQDRDLAENDAWAKGFGLRVQLILSEWMLNEVGL